MHVHRPRLTTTFLLGCLLSFQGMLRHFAAIHLCWSAHDCFFMSVTAHYCIQCLKPNTSWCQAVLLTSPGRGTQCLKPNILWCSKHWYSPVQAEVLGSRQTERHRRMHSHTPLHQGRAKRTDLAHCTRVVRTIRYTAYCRAFLYASCGVRICVRPLRKCGGVGVTCPLKWVHLYATSVYRHVTCAHVGHLISKFLFDMTPPHFRVYKCFAERLPSAASVPDGRTYAFLRV
jgi:hypothetical protein